MSFIFYSANDTAWKYISCGRGKEDLLLLAGGTAFKKPNSINMSYKPAGGYRRTPLPFSARLYSLYV